MRRDSALRSLYQPLKRLPQWSTQLETLPMASCRDLEANQGAQEQIVCDELQIRFLGLLVPRMKMS